MRQSRIIKSRLLAFLLVCFMVFSFVIPAYADTEYKNWNEVTEAMSVHIMDGVDIYEAGGEKSQKEAKDAINIAYFKFYEKLGFEKTVMAYISGSRGADVEHQFYLTKKAISDDAGVDKVRAEAEKLVEMLYEDANILDGNSGDSSEDAATDESTQAGGSTEEEAAESVPPSGSGVQDMTTFLTVFGLTMREGLEAILVIAAIVAYLVKTDNKKYLTGVYVGAIIGIVFSVLLAMVFNMMAASLGEAESGISQEIFEGIAMFVAVIVLFYVSNWMLSKAETEAWGKYIESKVESSISKGNLYALAFTAFLAVSREGAELILFFQGMRSNISNSPAYMWGGLAVAVILLVILYIAITKWSVRLPLKPFFTFTSVLMFILCISFIGKGVFELQEADVIGRTLIPAMGGLNQGLKDTLSFFGIYDRWETIIPQVIMLAITIISVVLHSRNNKKIKAEFEKNEAK